MTKNRKYLIIIFSVLGLLMIIGGTTYAWFTYRAETSEQELIAGDIYLHLNEGSSEIALTDIFPETAEEARSRDDNYITFDVTGKNTSNKTIYYEIVLDYGTDKASPKSRYRDQDLKFDLVALDNNGDEVEYLLSEVSYDTLVNKRIYVDTIDANTSNDVERHYKLRMWLSDDVIISDTATNATYTTTEYKNKYATIKLIVAGDFQEKEAPKQAYQLIQSLASSKNYIASYQDVVDDNPGLNFTTHDQVSDSATKQTVYYYTGNEAAANANVLFAGYCWQIVRTTDNGGVRMIYNGLAQKPVTASTSISNTDITYTNDGTYPYAYDSDTKKWSSANFAAPNSTAYFTFKVNTSGEYIINYNVYSSSYYDYAAIAIKKASESSFKTVGKFFTMSGTFDIGTLEINDEVKISYARSSSTSSFNNNMIIFDIASVNTRGDTPVCSQYRRTTEIKGIVQIGSGTTQSMSAASLYGRSYDYNLATGEFTIGDSSGLPSTWSTSDANSNGIEDYKELIGTYTCLSGSTTCSTLYYVGSINESDTTQAYVSKYTIGDASHYSQIGTSAFNSDFDSLAMVGYMFNKEYDYKSSFKSGDYYAIATWENGAYTLSNSNNGTSPDATHHYICESNNCIKVRYYFWSSNYIVLENGETIEDAIYKMIGNGTSETKSKTINANYELNKYNSSIKGYLDNWYKKNLTGYTSFLDGTSVYCNDRSISDLGGWNPSGTSLTDLAFNQYSANRDLNCVNETDRFAVTNTKAKLTYPIGLLTEPERNLMTSNFAKTGQNFWGASPYNFSSNAAYLARISLVNDSGNANKAIAKTPSGVRGVITLKPGTLFETGDGTYTNPYIVGPIVDRN